CLPHCQGRLYLVAGQRSHDQRALRMAVSLLSGDAALVDERLHEGVVFSDLSEFAVAEKITARVADVDEPKFVAREEDCGERGAHALEFWVVLNMSGDRRVALAHCLVKFGEQVATGFVVIQMGEGRDHQLGRHLAGGVAAHPVGQGQQAGAGVNRVFIIGADESAIAARFISEAKGHSAPCAPRVRGVITLLASAVSFRSSRPRRHGRSSITVLPIRTGVPIGTRTAVVTLSLSRYVPLVDPRSSTYHSVPCCDNRAWRVEA